MSASPVIRNLAQLDDYATLSDAAAGTPSLRTLGTAAIQAAAGNHGHAASAITSGVLAMARLATGTPNGTKFVRDDGTLQVPPGSGDPTMGGDITGTASAAVVTDDSHNHTSSTISGLDAADTTTGTFAVGRIPSITAAMVAADVATQTELDASALLAPILSPATSARNLITSPGVTVTPLTFKSAAGQDGLDASLLEFKDSSDDVWLRFKGPVTDPMPASPNVGGTGRMEFPYMGPSKGPVGVSSWHTNFDGSAVQGVSLGYNYEGGGGRVVTGDHGAAWVVETNYDYGPGVINEWYCEHLNQSGGGSVRPFYCAYEFGGATLQARLQVTTSKASQWDFIGANADTEQLVARFNRTAIDFRTSFLRINTEAEVPMLWVAPGAVTVQPAAGVVSTLNVRAAAGQYGRIDLGANAVDSVFLIYCDTATHGNLTFAGREGLHVHKPASGSSVSIGVNWNVAGLLVKNDQAVGTPVIIAQGKAGQTGNLFQAWTSAETPTWAINSAGHEVFADGFNQIFGTTTGTKIGTATTQKLGFWNAPPVVQPAAYTQTYATATRTHANPTAVTLTDNTAGTANTTLEALVGAIYTTDVVGIRNNFADLAAQHNALVVDVANMKQVLNSVIDDDQAVGLKA